MGYEPLVGFAAPARRSAEIGRTLAGAVLTFIAGLALYQASFALLSNLAGPTAMQAFADRTTFDRNSPAATLYILFTFGFFGFGLAMVVATLHRRPARTLVGSLPRAFADCLRVALPVGALFLFLALLLPQPVESMRNEALSRHAWIALLPFSLLGLLIQSGTEELFFRGYLQQQFAARFPNRPIWLFAPALLFGLAHFSPGTAGANAPLFVLWAVCFGLAASDLTARTGSIGAALGLHVGNNAVALLILSILGEGSGLALYHLPIGADDPRIAAVILPELLLILCGWLVARLALRV